jgi:hypothetical protein
MERILDEWLATVPCNKIFAFGADTGSAFMMLGYATQARNCKCPGKKSPTQGI